LVFYFIKETDRIASMSLTKELKFKMRYVAIRIVEAIYFIFFLPQTTKNPASVETTNSVLISSYIATSSLISLTLFTLFFLICKKSKKWALFTHSMGFWKEMGTASKGE
jgi:hypothetical protein